LAEPVSQLTELCWTPGRAFFQC